MYQHFHDFRNERVQTLFVVILSIIMVVIVIGLVHFSTLPPLEWELMICSLLNRNNDHNHDRKPLVILVIMMTFIFKVISLLIKMVIVIVIMMSMQLLSHLAKLDAWLIVFIIEHFNIIIMR